MSSSSSPPSRQNSPPSPLDPPPSIVYNIAGNQVQGNVNVAGDMVSNVTTSIVDDEPEFPTPATSSVIMRAPPQPAMVTQKNVVQGDQNIHGNFYNVTKTVIYPPGDANPPPAVTSLPPCPTPTNLFTGRTSFLTKIHNAMLTIEKPHDEDEGGGQQNVDPLRRMVVITGLGGVGKSELCKKYAQYYKPHHLNVAWINADTRSSLIVSFFVVARHFKICSKLTMAPQKFWLELPDDEIYDVVQRVYQHFSDHVKCGLFIFDNANQMGTNEEADGIERFLPESSFDLLPLFLLTSRNTIWGLPGDGIQPISLKPLENTETIEYFLRAFGLFQTYSSAQSLQQSPATVNKMALLNLAHCLGGYPLALNLAAAAITESVRLLNGENWRDLPPSETIEPEIKTYIDSFKTKGKEYLDHKHSVHVLVRYNHIMSTVWAGTIERIRQRRDCDGNAALQLLQLAAYLPTDFISVELCHVIQNDLPLTPVNRKNFKIEDARPSRLAFGLLERYSMVAVSIIESHLNGLFVSPNMFDFAQANSRSSRVAVHRLVQKYTKEMNDPFALIRIAEFCEKNFEFLHFINFRCVDHVIKLLKDRKWPSSTYRQYMYFHMHRGDSADQLIALHEIYTKIFNEHSQNQENLDEQVYLRVCKLGLIFNDQHELSIDPNRGFDITMTNCLWYPGATFNYEIKLIDYIHEVMDLATEHKHNFLVQKLATDVLITAAEFFRDIFRPVRRSQGIDWTTRKKMMEWLNGIHSFFQDPDITPISCLQPLAIRVFHIATKFQVKSILIDNIITTYTARKKDADWFDGWTYLFQTLQKLGAWPGSSWDQDKWSSLSAAEQFFVEKSVSDFKMFLNRGGTEILTRRLLVLLQNYKQGRSRLESGDDDEIVVFHLIQSISWRSDCASILVWSLEFMEVLFDFQNTILHRAVQVDCDAILLLLLLTSWLALLNACPEVLVNFPSAPFLGTPTPLENVMEVLNKFRQGHVFCTYMDDWKDSTEKTLERIIASGNLRMPSLSATFHNLTEMLKEFLKMCSLERKEEMLRLDKLKWSQCETITVE